MIRHHRRIYHRWFHICIPSFFNSLSRFFACSISKSHMSARLSDILSSITSPPPPFSRSKGRANIGAERGYFARAYSNPLKVMSGKSKERHRCIALKGGVDSFMNAVVRSRNKERRKAFPRTKIQERTRDPKPRSRQVEILYEFRSYFLHHSTSQFFFRRESLNFISMILRLIIILTNNYFIRNVNILYNYQLSA